jgi:hypothetical protein
MRLARGRTCQGIDPKDRVLSWRLVDGDCREQIASTTTTSISKSPKAKRGLQPYVAAPSPHAVGPFQDPQSVAHYVKVKEVGGNVWCGIAEYRGVRDHIREVRRPQLG